VNNVSYIFSLAVLALVAACSGHSIKNSVPAPQGVGIRTFIFKDTARNRELVTKVWYPSPQKEGPHAMAIFDSGAVENAPFPEVGEQRLPVVFLSHGSGGYAETLSWLAAPLASNGFLVLAPNHPGDSYGDVRPAGTFRKWDRAKDISFIIDHIDKNPDLVKLVDRQRIGVAGFSMGGYAALALAGVPFDRKAYESYCAKQKSADCGLFDGVDRKKFDVRGEQDPLVDARIRSAVALSPFGGPGAKAIATKTPIFIAGNHDDKILPFEVNAKRYFELLPHSRFAEFPKGGHYAMVGPCTDKGKMFAPEICADAPGVDRKEVQDRVGPETLEFFKATL